MFKATQGTQFVPTKVISVKPEAQVNYNPKTQNQLRWLLPQYLGFIDPRSTYMKYKIQMSGRGHTKPDWRAGVHSIWRDVRIQDGTGSAELEMIQDYNVLTANWWNWTNNESIDNKRDMFEGRSRNTDIDNQLFYGASPAWAVGAQKTETFEKKIVEVQQPIYSGILGGDRVFPISATKGLRVQMTLDDLRRSLVFNDTLGIQSDTNNAQFVELKNALNVGDNAKTAIGDEDNIKILQPEDSSDGRGVFRNATPYNNNPFDIGDAIYVSDEADGANEEQLGIITGFTLDGEGDMTVVYCPNRALTIGLTNAHAVKSRVYIKASERINGGTATNVPDASVNAFAVPISYELSDIEMLVLQVQPPEGYVSAMMGQVNSSSGLSIDFRSWTLYRFNLNTINGLTNQLIPANQQRAYSILSVPLAINNQNVLDANASSLVGVADNAQNYQYVFRGNLIPDRPVKTERFSQLIPTPNALALVETEKALVNCNYGVRNLQNSQNRFLVARAFSKYNQVFDLSAGDLALRVEYEGATDEKLYEHFVQYIRRITIGANGTQVSF
tara:strand:+ start:1341 stop:3008 length:1668 start_codon:yes stop_codon:yes gene_type:complete